jgi:hypothetical protein
MASQIASNSQSKNDVTSSMINALQTGDFASAFNNILTGVANKTIGTALVPIKGTLDTMIDTMDKLNDNIHSGKKMVTQTRGFAFTAINDFVSQIYAVIGSVQDMVVRIIYLMKRVVAVFVSIIYATRSGLAIGESFSNSVFGKILMFFCFKGDTIVELKSGEKRYISQLRIGDELKHDGVVIGFVKCSGRYISIYDIDGIKLSGEHYVFDESDDLWKPARLHHRAVLTNEKCEFLYNIETTKKTITLSNGLRCLDYDDDGILHTIVDKCSEWIGFNKKRTVTLDDPDDPVDQNNLNDPNKYVLSYRYLSSDGKTRCDKLYYDKPKDIYLWKNGKVAHSLPRRIDFIDRMITNNLFQL